MGRLARCPPAHVLTAAHGPGITEDDLYPEVRQGFRICGRSVAATAPCPRGHILYVGDRVDNDVMPARRARMRAGFVLRGPWAWLHRNSPEAALADFRIRSLDELPGLVVAGNR